MSKYCEKGSMQLKAMNTLATQIDALVGRASRKAGPYAEGTFTGDITSKVYFDKLSYK